MDYFQLWVFGETFSIDMKLSLVFLTFKVRSAIVCNHENIFSQNSFIVTMEKKFDLTVLSSHIHLEGEKSRLLKKIGLKWKHNKLAKNSI